MNPDPLSVICPLCGALPGEPCVFYATNGAPRAQPHGARFNEAFRVQACNAEPTRPL